jgi:hypothetical protein
MHGLYGSWKQWLKAQFAAAPGHHSRRLRKQRSALATPVAADVELLETRALLAFTYHGGALIPNVQAQDVFMGSDWKNNVGNIQTTLVGKLDSFLNTAVSGAQLDGLTLAGYRVYRGTTSPSAIDNLTINKNFTLQNNFFLSSGGFDDLQIQAELQKMIKANQVQAPTPNRLYVVYVEPGVVVTQGFANSMFFFGGYHGAFNGTNSQGAPADIRYAVLPYPAAPNLSGTTQVLDFALNNLTIVTSHELSEAVTDPDVSFAQTITDPKLGWYDSFNNGEVGDLSEGFTTMINGFEVQMMENQGNGFINPNAQTHTLAAPTNLTLSAISAIKGQLSWTGSPLAQGYNIFSVNGATLTKIGSAGAGATSFTINGVTAGTHVSYMVQAFDGTFTANSKVLTGISTFASVNPGTTTNTQSHTTTNAPIFVAAADTHVSPTTAVKPRNYYALGIVNKIIP